jgi:hypothetical protein
MFALQAGAIRNALVQAGIPMRAAQQLSAILSNTAAEYRTGKITQDSTPEGLQLVEGEARKHQFVGLDPLADDPDHRINQLASTEERVPAQQPSDVTQPLSSYEQPQGRGAEVVGGAYVAVRTEGTNRVVALRAAGVGTHPTLDPQSDAIVGKGFRASVGNEDMDKIRSFITEAADEVVWNTQLVNLTPIVVVTAEPSGSGRAAYGLRKIYAWCDAAYGVQSASGLNDGDGANLTVLTGVTWSGSALVGNYASVNVNAINANSASTIATATECQ